MLVLQDCSWPSFFAYRQRTTTSTFTPDSFGAAMVSYSPASLALSLSRYKGETGRGGATGCQFGMAAAAVACHSAEIFERPTRSKINGANYKTLQSI